MTWRDRAKPIIAEALKETEGQDETAIRAALYQAYPFGPRQYHPYKAWLDEIKVQRGLKKATPKAVEPPDPRQPEMFSE